MTPLPGRLRSTLDERQIVSRQPDKVVLNETITVVPNQTIIPSAAAMLVACMRGTSPRPETLSQ